VSSNPILLDDRIPVHPAFNVAAPRSSSNILEQALRFGDEEDEPKKVKDSRKLLNKTRKQMRTDELSDNDDVYGFG
jgi:hypothetical protein